MHGKLGSVRTFSFIFTFIMMYLFWLLNSGVFEIFYMSLGLACALVVAYAFHSRFTLVKDYRHALKSLIRFAAYLPWITWQIILSNWDIVKRVLSPGMPIDPCIISFQSTLKSDIAMTTLGNSITLTPGTITIDIDYDGTFYVHSIAREPADSLLTTPPCEMAARVGYIFGESRKWN
ncbi:MAG: Na+/H+ antiporter subunit E [Candidatus Methanoperedens sp.]|jgi:multicomponent Na+:H+ antiporter subunit E|nr:Na+/H+ antiporter subunit E [Candidatus Methanoperedens sp.]PKL54539.1 MAG: cation:proton antiporter [Candidatus Methanoperedenaceae archaeon HGW-Methanoperedenaceae-1]